MSKKRRLPEGLEEMAKEKDGVNPKELRDGYREIYDEVKETDVSRRKVLYAFGGGGGLAVLNALFAQKKYLGEDLEAGLKAVMASSDNPLGVQHIDRPPYEVDDEVYERFGEIGTPRFTNDMGFISDIVAWIKEEGGTPTNPEYLYEHGLEAAGTSIKSDAYGSTEIPAEDKGTLRSHLALMQSLREVRFRYGTSGIGKGGAINFELQRAIAMGEDYEPLAGSQAPTIPKFPWLTEHRPDTSDPVEHAVMVKKTARLNGVSAVGIADLDMRWMYKSLSYRRKEAPITFEDVDRPIINDEEMVIPKSVDKVVVGAVEIPLTLNQMSPTPASSGATFTGYGRQNMVAAALATFIRHMGYNAIPSGNDTGLSIPMAIDAGLGEYGRNCRVITPNFGPNVRLFKVLTDMPLETDPFIRFGATKFCEGCKICAEQCPSKAISFGPQTWKYEGTAPESWKKVSDRPWAASRNPGVKKWYSNPHQCVRYWVENGAKICSHCMVSCPFTQGRSWLHDIVRVAAGTSGSLDTVMADMSAVFGYERFRSPLEVWDHDYLPFGLEQDPALGDV